MFICTLELDSGRIADTYLAFKLIFRYNVHKLFIRYTVVTNFGYVTGYYLIWTGLW